MTMVWNEEQQMLARSARQFARERTPVAAGRVVRDDASGGGFDPKVSRAMAELGWFGLVLPEDVGGLGLGYAELGIVLEELGRELVASPLFSSAVLGSSALLCAGGVQQGAVLEAVAEGDHLLALAHQEGPRHDPYRCTTRAERCEGGYVLCGEKHYVLQGHVADTLLVVARTTGEEGAREGLSLFAVQPGAPGVDFEPLGMVDGRTRAHVSLSGVELSADRLVGEADGAAELLDTVLDRAAIALSAEMLGGAQAAFELTLDYLKTRKQFGVPIGSFQALKHRAADLYTELELTRSVVLDALHAVDAQREDVSLVASTAKARASEVFLRVAAEGIQMHGGIGVTEEADIGLYYKRARACEQSYGDAVYHRDRFARLSGY